MPGTSTLPQRTKIYFNKKFGAEPKTTAAWKGTSGKFKIAMIKETMLGLFLPYEKVTNL